MRQDLERIDRHCLARPAMTSLSARAALVGNVGQADARCALEQFDRQMRRRALPGVPKLIESASLRLAMWL
jgi:hypothetical protein